MINMLRPKAAWTQIGVGRTKFKDDIIAQPGGDEFIPGTRIARLRPVKLGHRSTAFPSDEVEALIEALKADRDVKHNKAKPAAKRRAASSLSENV